MAGLSSLPGGAGAGRVAVTMGLTSAFHMAWPGLQLCAQVFLVLVTVS